MSGNSLSSAEMCQSDSQISASRTQPPGWLHSICREKECGQNSDAPTPNRCARAKMDEIYPVYPPLEKLQGPITLANPRGTAAKEDTFFGLVLRGAFQAGRGGAVISTCIGDTLTRRHRAKDQVTFASCHCE